MAHVLIAWRLVRASNRAMCGGAVPGWAHQNSSERVGWCGLLAYRLQFEAFGVNSRVIPRSLTFASDSWTLALMGLRRAHGLAFDGGSSVALGLIEPHARLAGRIGS